MNTWPGVDAQLPHPRRIVPDVAVNLVKRRSSCEVGERSLFELVQAVGCESANRNPRHRRLNVVVPYVPRNLLDDVGFDRHVARRPKRRDADGKNEWRLLNA